jgi:hypothetical protein
MVSSQYIPLTENAKVFVSSRHIKRKPLVNVWKKDTLDAWSQISQDDFDLVNNSIVLDTELDYLVNPEIELRVADSETELVGSPSDISILAGIEDDIQTLSDNITDINTVADNILDVQTATDAATNAIAAANQAEVYKDEASNSANNAATSETNAQTYSQNSFDYSQNALTSETNAALSEASALTSQTNAAISEANAAASAAEAAGYASSLNIDELQTDDVTISIVTTVNENTTIQGTITNYDANATYLIEATNGTITNITGNTFDYTAPDITDGDDDVDVISYSALVSGKLYSDVNTTGMTIVYTPIVADDSYVDNLAVDDSEINIGWSIV